jgi:hypothetical protein
MKYAVIGLGEFGGSAAVGLFRKGAEVIAVDTNMERVNSGKDEVSLAVRLDATHEDALKSHGLGEVDVLIAAIGNNFEAQVLVVVHAKEHGIKKIIARIASCRRARGVQSGGNCGALDGSETAHSKHFKLFRAGRRLQRRRSQRASKHRRQDHRGTQPSAPVSDKLGSHEEDNHAVNWTRD